MPITVECPACEQVFRISSKYRDKKGRCPVCDCSFIADDTVISAANDTITTRPPPPSAPTIPLPTVVRQSTASPPTSPPIPPSQPGVKSASPDSSSVILADGDDANSDLSFSDAASEGMIAQELKAGRSVQKSSWIALLAAVVFVGGGIAVGVFIMGVTPDESANSENEKSDTKNDQVVVVTEQAADDTSKNTKPGEKAKLHPDELPELLSLNQLHNIWSSTYPYIVQLKVTSTTGNQNVTGIIIDTRGWIATSYSAIKNAIRIDVVLSEKSFDEGQPFQTETKTGQDGQQTEIVISDPLRGLLVTDPSYDIAILSCNRQLVRSPTDLQIDTQSLIVDSQRILLGRAPQSDRRLWLQELRIAGRAETAQLDADDRQLVQQLELKPAEDFRWIIHQSNFVPAFAGSALLSRDGKLIGMGIYGSDKTKNCLAIPIQKVVDLKQTAELASVSPLPKFGQASALAVNADATATNQQSPEFKALQALNKTIENCKAFDFAASTAAELTELIGLPAKIGAVKKTINESITETEALTAANKRLADAVSAAQKHVDNLGINQIRGDDISKSNLLVIANAKKHKEAPIVLFATVFRGSILSPELEGKKTIIFDIDGTDQKLITTADENHFDFRPGKRWMLIGNVHKRSAINIRDEDNNRQRLLRAEIFLCFEIVE